MRYMMLAQILLLTSVAFANEKPASCTISKSSILSLSSAGLPQVSNLGLIELTCSVPARPFPSKPGEFRNGLRAATTAYEISTSGNRKKVPSKVIVSGSGGGGPGDQEELVAFTLYLPLDRAERDLEARRYFDRLLENLPPGSLREQLLSRRKQILETGSEDVSQHRTGRFEVQCRILDGTRVIGVGVIQLEVLFKGRFSDSDGFPGYWQTQRPDVKP